MLQSCKCMTAQGLVWCQTQMGYTWVGLAFSGKLIRKQKQKKKVERWQNEKTEGIFCIYFHTSLFT